MPLTPILSAGDKATIRAGGYSATPYILANPKNIVFAAQVNQATFGSPFATVEFDNISTGAITNVLDGFSVFIGDIQDDVRNFTFAGRARGDGTPGTTLDINETDANLTDDQYITVIKDVAMREILGRYINRVMTVDWDKTFRQLLPRVTGLKSAYAKKLVSAIADFTFPAVGNVTNSGAAIASWLWDADGGSFINGTVATDAQPDIRYTVAGVYWPRVQVTDDGGRVGWFTMPVFVASNDLSDAWIITGSDNIGIQFPFDTGPQLEITNFSDEMAAVPERSFIALWNLDNYDGDTDPIVDDIIFVGRLRSEVSKNTIAGNDGPQPDTPFICEGVLAQMNRLRTPQLALTDTVSPTEFGQIATMTQWRVASFVLTEFSTVANVCSLSFDVEDNTYRNREDSTEDQSLLAAINTILGALKSALNTARQGEIFGARNAVFMDVPGRNALDTVTTFTDNDTFDFSIPRNKVPDIGKVGLWAGAYNTTDSNLRIIHANAPAVASNEAQGIGSPINGILLASDATLDEQKTEAERLVADSLVALNPKDIPGMAILDGYHFLSPANFQWYGWLVAATDNNRGIVYTAADRFLLTDVSTRFDNVVSSWDTTITLSHETQGGAAQTISQLQPNAIEPGLPLIPSVQAYPGFPALPTLFLPTGWTDANVPAIGVGEGAIIITPVEPFAQADIATLNGSVFGLFDADELFLTLELADKVACNWASIFEADSTFTIKDFKFDPHSRGAYALVNDGSNNSKFYYTGNIFESQPSWSLRETFSDINYDTIKTTSTPDRVYVFGLDDRVPPAVVTLLDGNGTEGLSPSSTIDPGSSEAWPGIYDAGLDAYDGQHAFESGFFRGYRCNIEYEIPGDATVTKVEVWYDNDGNAGGRGDRTASFIFYQGATNKGAFNWTIAGASGAYPPGANHSNVVAALSVDRLYVHLSTLESGSTFLRVRKLEITMTTSGNAKTAYRLSDDAGTTFGSLRKSATEIVNTADDAGYASGATDDFAYIAADDIIRKAENEDEDTDKTGSDSAGTYAKSILAYGKNAEADMIFATKAAFGGVTMMRIETDTPTDITPNDGAFDGLIVGRNALAMSRISDDDIWALSTYNTDVKLSITDDRGDTWSFSAKSFTSGAKYLRVKETNVNQLYIVDSAVVKYSEDGGISFETDRPAPTLFALGGEVR